VLLGVSLVSVNLLVPFLSMWVVFTANTEAAILLLLAAVTNAIVVTMATIARVDVVLVFLFV
jgi:hypothetical protein